MAINGDVPLLSLWERS